MVGEKQRHNDASKKVTAPAGVTVAGSGQRPEAWLSPGIASPPTMRNQLGHLRLHQQDLAQSEQIWQLQGHQPLCSAATPPHREVVRAAEAHCPAPSGHRADGPQSAPHSPLQAIACCQRQLAAAMPWPRIRAARKGKTPPRSPDRRRGSSRRQQPAPLVAAAHQPREGTAEKKKRPRRRRPSPRLCPAACSGAARWR
ncbi:hypothetical protein BRADI_4g15156v3 [Brachypodium distachyon]|uniref:Uncharacterized protein n=1 Tax=Brachypodium distachyon TaxID=15368 RepID=A0A0Q3HI46_BRADI|nr:hypothetical protein BRADI_4g15156v3 [Brachypodium distachyon]